MNRWIAASFVAALVLALGWALAPADATASSPPDADDAGVIQMADPAKEPDMDHQAKKHHHHQHLADHRGAEHSARGLGEHHHHHHAHPHGPDPHHHHPH